MEQPPMDMPPPPNPLPGAHEIAPGVWLPEAALAFTFSRSGGPGGQNVNKVASRAQLRVPLAALRAVLPAGAGARLAALAAPWLTAAGDLLFSCGESRSQHANKQECLARLRALVVQALVKPRPRRATRPSAGARRRRLEHKRQHGAVKRGRGSAGAEE